MPINRELLSLLSAVFLFATSSSANAALITADGTADAICGAGDPNICLVEHLSPYYLSGVAGDTFEFKFTLNDRLHIQLGIDVDPNIGAGLVKRDPVAVTWDVSMALSEESGDLVTEFIPVHGMVCDEESRGCGFGGYPHLTPVFDNITFHGVHFIFTTSAPTPIPIEVEWNFIEFVSSTGEVGTVPIPPIFSSILPSSRSVQVNVPATAFATIVNPSGATATDCSLSPITNLPADFLYQTTDPLTNALTGTPNTPVTIAPEASQSFVIAFTPWVAFSPTEVELQFECSNTAAAPTFVGLNTLLLSASDTPNPDIVALAATLAGDGIANIAGATGDGVFAVAVANVGATGTITASFDTGGVTLPVGVSICQSNPTSGSCISPVQSSVVTTIDSNETAAFVIFLTGRGNIPFDPANNRVFVRFQDAGGVTRGSTSVAVRTL